MDAVVVKGSSMSSCFKEGDVLLFKKAEISDIKIGKVIVFNFPNNDELVFHRIIKIISEGENKRFVTKGDKISSPDPEIEFSSIQGIVVARLRNGRFKRFSRMNEIFQLAKSVSNRRIARWFNINKLRFLKFINFFGLLIYPLVHLGIIPLRSFKRGNKNYLSCFGIEICEIEQLSDENRLKLRGVLEHLTRHIKNLRVLRKS